jgi:hypothetical protein
MRQKAAELKCKRGGAVTEMQKKIFHEIEK